MITFMRIVVTAVAVSGLAAGTVASQGATPPKTVDLLKYPAAVRAAIEKETTNAAIKGVSKETEKGQVQYEVETIVNGHTRDFNVDPSGKILVVEEEILLDAAPAPVRDALKQYVKVLRLEKVEQDGKTRYEASVQRKNGKKASVELDADGKPVKR